MSLGCRTPGPQANLQLRRLIVERQAAPDILLSGLVTPEDVTALFEMCVLAPYLSLSCPLRAPTRWPATLTTSHVELTPLPPSLLPAWCARGVGWISHYKYINVSPGSPTFSRQRAPSICAGVTSD